MRSEKEIRRAIALIGTALAYPKLRQWVFGGNQNESTARAWYAFSALGWVAGADETLLAALVEMCETKLREYGVVFGERVIPEDTHVQ